MPSSSRCTQNRHIGAREAGTPHKHVHIRALLEAPTVSGTCADTQAHTSQHGYTTADTAHLFLLSYTPGYLTAYLTSAFPCLGLLSMSTLTCLGLDLPFSVNLLLHQAAPAPQTHPLVHSTSIY